MALRTAGRSGPSVLNPLGRPGQVARVSRTSTPDSTADVGTLSRHEAKWTLPRDDDGAIGHVQDLVRDASDDRSAPVGEPPRAHHDNAHVLLSSDLDYLGGNVAVGGHTHYDSGADPDVLQRVPVERGHALPVLWRLARIEPSPAHLRFSLGHVAHDHLAARQTGQLRGDLTRASRPLRAVHRQQEPLKHDPLPLASLMVMLHATCHRTERGAPGGMNPKTLD